MLLLVAHFLCRSTSLRDQTLFPLVSDLAELPQRGRVEGRETLGVSTLQGAELEVWGSDVM